MNPGANFDRAASAAGRASGQVDNFNNRQRQSEEGARKVASAWGLVKKAIGSALAAISVQKVIELADSMTSTRARLDIMNDGLQTTDELQSMIMKSANRSRAAYQTTADAVSKMGIMAKDAFSNNDELIKFTELINKQFTIAGTSAAGIDAAMLQLTQAMSSGVLRGEELNSVFEQAPTIIQTIADYLDVPIGKIRDMAADGQITSTIVKNAMLASADEINAKFEAMPMTFAQVWTIAKISPWKPSHLLFRRSVPAHNGFMTTGPLSPRSSGAWPVPPLPMLWRWESRRPRPGSQTEPRRLSLRRF